MSITTPAAIKLLEIQTDPVIGKLLADSISDPAVVRMVREAIDNGRVVTRECAAGTVSRRCLRAPLRSGDVVVGDHSRGGDHV